MERVAIKLESKEMKALVQFSIILIGIIAFSAGLFFSGTSWAEMSLADHYKRTGLPPSVPDETSPLVDLSKIKQKEPPWVIGYASPGLTNSWQQEAAAQIQWAVEQSRDKIKEFYWTNGKESIPKQIADVEDLMTKGIDALLIATVNSEALNRTLRKVIKAGVPVILHERGVSDPNAYTVWMSVDNYEQGAVQFRFIAKQLGGKGDIVILHGLPGSGACDDQSKGYADVHKKFPGIKILATEYTNYSRQLGKTKMENILQAYSKIDGILCNSGIQGLGVFEAVKEAGRMDEIKAWAGDDSVGWLKVIHEQKLNCGIAPVPSWGILDGLQVAFDLLQGKPTRKIWVIPCKNVDFTDIPALGVLDLPGDLWLTPVPYDVILDYMKKL